ncbi:hypothetical protein PCASD_21836 [Puccinia coronata f. sp. avenae]|uniref:Uncharacterized protein n=1 Tax=Puccinia coronata f. sp. avenae TaxID=200324 RepID=A0A2N5TKD6_9BASI|nr:hypothetical protein PCASD_21836 [Puccinia coronata f. sp. avenae]
MVRCHVGQASRRSLSDIWDRTELSDLMSNTFVRLACAGNPAERLLKGGLATYVNNLA